MFSYEPRPLYQRQDAQAPPPTQEFLDETLQPVIRGIMYTFTILAVIVVGLRCYTRLFLRRVFGLDDWVMVLTVILLIAYLIIIELGVQAGLGRHIDWILLQGDNRAVRSGFLSILCQPLIIMCCALGKTSFALTLMRVAAQRWIHWVLWAIVSTLLACHITISILLFCRCEDVRTLWDPSIVSECWPAHVFNDFSLFVGTYSAASDFALAASPWVMLWGIQMKKKEKLAVLIAMSFGVVAGSVAIVKTTNLKANQDTLDPPYALAPLLWWAGFEACLIIFGACLPTLRPMLSKVFPSTAKASGGSNSNSNSLALNTISGSNRFIPKSKRGEWSAIVETNMVPDDASDDQSDRNILPQYVTKGHGTTGTAVTVDENAPSHARPGRLSNQAQIHKTMEVTVDYGSKAV